MNEPLAIVGMGCRLPGGAHSPESYWKMLCSGTDAIREIPADRWSIAAHYDATPGRVGKSISKWGGFLDRIAGFDSAFFGISAREADAMDPQQRLLLEAAWEAFEDAGQQWDELRGSPTGVFVGISTYDYTAAHFNVDGSNSTGVYSAPGCAFSIAANRISYCLDLRGPSLATDTACSSALTACHLACQSLWRGDCSMALVAGVNALLNLGSFLAFSRMSMLSPDGHCKAFDARANGFVRAEGVGAVVLKPLRAALAAHDRIYAVIRTTAANQDGRTNGITLPSQAAQEELIRLACRRAGIAPGSIGYVEAHGTGTAVGDPIETAALGAALAEGRTEPCLIGSVKTNIGHLEAASGIASLIKVALILKHRQIPPTLHFATPNPHIDFEGLKLRVVDRMQPFPERGGTRLAGVNSFGFGGANAHVILEAAPPQAEAGDAQLPPLPSQLVLPLAAHSAAALRQAAGNFGALLAQTECDAHALCGAAATRRSGFAHRLCVAAESRQEMAERLNEFAAGAVPKSVVSGESIAREAPVFVCSGQGTQSWRMGRDLLRDEPVFRARIEECDALFRTLGSWSLIEELTRSEQDSRLHETALAQPAIFAVQVALAALWESWGVRPAAVVGHSVGEAAAACIAGALTLPEAARIIFHRARTMNPASNRGRMLAAALSAAQAEEIVAAYPGQVVVGAYNSPVSVALSGDPKPLEEIAWKLEARGVFNRFLKVNYAFHSHQMDVVQDELLESLGTVDVAKPRIPLYSTVTAALYREGDFTAEYWWRNVRQPVRFAESIAAISAQGHKLFLELGAHPALTIAVTETLSARSAAGQAFYSLRRMAPERDTMLHNLAALYTAGATVDWTKLYPGAFGEVSLPTYPWQHQEHWSESRVARAARLDASPHFFLERKLDVAGPVWHTALDVSAHAWLRDHRVLEHVLLPGAAMIEAALEAGVTLSGALPVEASEIDLKKALVLPEGKEAVDLQTAYSPVDAMVRFSSRRAEEASGDWTLHSTAKVRAQSGTGQAALPLKQLMQLLGTRLERQQIYAICRLYGLNYGPAFQGLECVWRNEREALGKIVLSEELAADAGKFQIHPALLDACFQTVFFAAPEPAERQTSVPVGVDRLLLLARPGKVVYCHAKLVQYSQRSATWNFQVADEQGRLLLDAEGFRTQSIRGAGARADDPEEWLYESKWVEKPLAAGSELALRQLAGTWLLFADRTGVAAELAKLLRAHGAEPLRLEAETFVKRSEGGQAQLSSRLEAELGTLLSLSPSEGGPAGIVHLWSLDAARLDEAGDEKLDGSTFRQAEVLGCHSLLKLVQAMAEAQSTLPLWIATSGAQSVDGKLPLAVTQSMTVGMGRTILSEFPRLPIRLIDLGLGPAKPRAHSLVQEMMGGDDETEVAWRGQMRYANRIAHRAFDSLTAPPLPTRNAGYWLEIPASGAIDDLAWYEKPRRRPATGEIEVEVEAAAINFRDVLKSLALYPIECNRDLLLGDECAGRVVAVGKNVTAFQPGDAVISTGAGCFASHLTIPAACAVRKPASLTFEEAATIPIAFMTAWHALHQLGRIRRGESILIHAAAGGVGLAAMQLARLAGAQIYATAGSEEKRAFLRKLGALEVFDSRTTTFAAEVRRATNGRGLDLVLNSLAGDAIAKGISALAPGGRFLEIGKRDIYANTAIGLRPLRNNVSVHVIDMGQILAASPEQVQELLQAVMKLFRAGKLKPLPFSALPYAQAIEAFRRMAQARHIGKIVLTAKAGNSIEPQRRLPRERIQFTAKASYLVTGGLGGFGLELARWLVAHGARHLVLASRSGAATPESKRAVAALRRAGVHVKVIKADVADERQVARMMGAIAGMAVPLRGIFHAAGVLDDGILTQLTPARLSRVLAPKAQGAWNLHRHSLKLRLEHFVLFSSVSALLGTQGQANYVAANCFLDALAHHRHALGLAALAVNWGAINEVGMVARNQSVAKHLSAHGVEGIAPAVATGMLGRLLQSECAQIGVMRIDWNKVFAPGASPGPRYSEVIAGSASSEAEDAKSFRALIHTTPPEARLELTASLIRETVAAILRTDAAKLDVARPLNEMGLDSLMAFEMINRLEDRFGVPLPTGSITSGSSMNSVAARVLENFGSGDAVTPAAPSGVSALTAAKSQAVVLRAGNASAPLLLLHPVGGSIEIYAELASRLPQGLHVVGIQSRLVAGRQDEYATLDELARGYAEIAASLQPQGPMRLAGFSAGSIFALATARELERRGRKVCFVGAIEAPFAALDPECPPEKLLKNLIVEIFEWTASELGLARMDDDAKFGDSTFALSYRILAASNEDEQLTLVTDWFTQHGTNLSESQPGVASIRQTIRRMIRHALLVNQCRIEPLAAPVWSWKAAQSQLTAEELPTHLRQAITLGQFSHRLLAGRHFEAMRAPAVVALANEIVGALAQAEGGT